MTPRPLLLALCRFLLCLLVATPVRGDEDLAAWRAGREARLRAENGWLALVGRYPLAPGVNTIGTATDSDIRFPDALGGVGPARLGAVVVDALAGTVTLEPEDGASFVDGDGPVAPPRRIAVDEPDWVGIGRFRFQIIQRHGTCYLRLADNESPARRHFPGCSWYPAEERFRVEATFVAHGPGDTLRLVDISGRAVDRPCPGHAEFHLDGRDLRLDAVDDDGSLFFVFRDATAGDTTYPAGRFLTVEGRPADRATFTLDFNRAYNPPCAVSAHTTCPTPPPGNVLDVRVEAGERFPPAGAAPITADGVPAE